MDLQRFNELGENKTFVLAGKKGRQRPFLFDEHRKLFVFNGVAESRGEWLVVPNSSVQALREADPHVVCIHLGATEPKIVSSLCPGLKRRVVDLVQECIDFTR